MLQHGPRSDSCQPTTPGARRAPTSNSRGLQWLPAPPERHERQVSVRRREARARAEYLQKVAEVRGKLAAGPHARDPLRIVRLYPHCLPLFVRVGSARGARGRSGERMRILVRGPVCRAQAVCQDEKGARATDTAWRGRSDHYLLLPFITFSPSFLPSVERPYMARYSPRFMELQVCYWIR